MTLSNGPWLHVWYAANRPDVYTLAGHEGAVRRARFAPDGGRVLTASDDGTARLWSTPRPGDAGGAANGALLGVLRGHEGPVLDARFSHDGALALTLSADGTARVWELAEEPRECRVLAHGGALVWGDFSADDARVLTVAEDGVARVLALAGDADVLALDAPRVTCAAFSADGARVATGGADGTVRLFDAAGGAPLAEHAVGSAVVALAFHPAEEELAVACADRWVHFVHPRTGAETRTGLNPFALRALAYDAAGRRLLVTATRGVSGLRVYDLASDEQWLEQGRNWRPEVFHTADLTSAAFSADGRLLLTTSHDGSAYVRHADSGAPIAHWMGPGGAVLAAAFGPEADGRRVVAACADGTARVWPVDPLPAALARQPRALREWEVAREQRIAAPLRYP